MRYPTAVLAAVLTAVCAAPAEAAFPGANGRIAFERGVNVWTMEPDGSAAKQVTTSGGTFTPALSADGRRIAVNIQGDIVVMDADGGNRTNVTASSGTTDSQPAWSPDGTRIAYSSGSSGQPFRIWTIGADGTNPLPLTSTSSGDFSPAWSPDGTRIAYVRTGNSTDIYTIGASAPGPETFYAGTPNSAEDQPSWAPDGSAIAFTTNRRDGGGNEIYKQVGAGGTGV